MPLHELRRGGLDRRRRRHLCDCLFASQAHFSVEATESLAKSPAARKVTKRVLSPWTEDIPSFVPVLTFVCVDTSVRNVR
jgi:hypothetical protein